MKNILMKFFDKGEGFKYTFKILFSDLKGVVLSIIISIVGYKTIGSIDLFLPALVVTIVGASMLLLSLTNLLLGVGKHFSKF
jgi:uncharacterized membrane-anchored protein